jgi:hypothetical protein
VTEGADLLARDRELAHVEEAHLLERPAVELLDDLPGVGALDLEAVVLAVHGGTVRAGRRTVVVAELDVVAAGLGVELQPVRAGSAADVHVLVLALVEEDAVADHAAVGGGGHELLRRVQREIREAVDAGVGQQLQRVGSGDEEVDHVVGLVEEHRGLAPGDLLASPVGEFGRNDRVDVCPELRVAQVFDGVSRLVEDFLQIAGHVVPFQHLRLVVLSAIVRTTFPYVQRD